MERRYTVYMHVSPKNKVYIGITCRKPEKRWAKGAGYSQNAHFFNAIMKYGWDNFQHIILGENLNKSDACFLEQHYIKMFKATDARYGYNQSTGGEWGGIGVVFTEERRKKIGESHKGMKHTEKAKQMMSEGHKGRPSWNKGRRWNEAERETMRKAQKRAKAVICVETKEIYSSIREAAVRTGINRSSIKDCCHHRQFCLTAGGFHWEFF